MLGLTTAAIAKGLAPTAVDEVYLVNNVPYSRRGPLSAGASPLRHSVPYDDLAAWFVPEALNRTGKGTETSLHTA
jgi:hypothetical protein